MTPERFARLKHALLRRQHDLTVLADGVHKDHNVSAIIRTCDAVGVARLHAVSPDGEFRRHHMVAGGSKRWVALDLHAEAAEAYASFRKADMQILAAHSAGDAVDFRDIDFTQPTAIVLGAELIGPSPYAIDNADQAIRIPMYGLVESLNVSVAAAVLLFEAPKGSDQPQDSTHDLHRTRNSSNEHYSSGPTPTSRDAAASSNETTRR